MIRVLQKLALVLAVTGAAISAKAFSLLGQFAPWQVPAIGYALPGIDIGGPMAINEGYRWNIRTIYYGFDSSFMHYFGAQGSNAVVQALEVINNLPPMSKLSPDLHEFPTDTSRINYKAASFGIMDVKSTTLAFMMEELGLASPERYTWTLRGKTPIAGTANFLYAVIMRNFDPVTTAPTPYVNDILYTYSVIDPIAIDGINIADAVEFPVDPLQNFTTLASASDQIYGYVLLPGRFFTGLTRDDVAGLRYLYRKGLVNSYYESLVTNAILNATNFIPGVPWTPVGGSNALVNAALRPGVDKFLFKLMPKDSGFGNFIAFTNLNKDTYYTNSHLIPQNYQRSITLPDVIFTAEDLGLNAAGVPVLFSRSGTAGWANNTVLNNNGITVNPPTHFGPGNIEPSVIISFSTIGPYFINESPSTLDQANFTSFGFVWGSFDGTTNNPIVYPIGMTIQDLENILFNPF